MENFWIKILSLLHFFLFIQLQCYQNYSFDYSSNDYDLYDNNFTSSQIAIVIIIENSKIYENHRLAIESIKCYSLQYGYIFKLINFQLSYNLPILCPQEDFLFARHCATSIYMEKFNNTIKYVFSLKPDIGIINPLHRLEKLITNENIIFIRPLHSHEIASSPYIIKNNRYGRMFLKRWANFFYKMPSTFHFSDNGALMGMLLMKFYSTKYNSLYKTCLHIFSTSKTTNNYIKFCVCVNDLLEKVSELNEDDNSQIYDNKRIKILSIERSYKNFVRDIWITKSKWAPQDFMLSDLIEKNRYIKTNKYKYWENPLQNNDFKLHQCKKFNFLDQWNYLENFILNNTIITNYLKKKRNYLEEEHLMYKKEIDSIIPKKPIHSDSFIYIRSAFQIEYSQNYIILFLSRRQNIRLKNITNLREIQINDKKGSINDNIGAYSGKISIKKYDKKFSNLKKITIKRKKYKIRQFAVCTPILQNFDLPGKLLQFIKYWLNFDDKIKIYIYYNSWSKIVDNMIKKILKYKKNIRIINWSNLPYNLKSNNFDPNFGMIDKGQQLANMDCVLRNKNKAKYVILSRLDQEFVHNNVSHFLDGILKKHSMIQMIKVMLQDKIINKNNKFMVKNKVKFLNPNFYNMIIFLPDRLELPLKNKYVATVVDKKFIYTRIIGYQRVIFNVSKDVKISWYSLPLRQWSKTNFIQARNSWFKY
ncbi:Protein of unknown function DUF273 family-containing protein [Strongyloides ratti]|uniref:Glycosyltransferase family 92 protein n=1 Tax=Strongyloides ratti TaxID=34506 RepID=A0A090LQY0_STRRB|nr:Protein of unknown function DUF273 family-containing protein [Strongyloides ratti]CEF70011.1 Protein of unknown function DUF273 family-containing protein [Strongyloides ratti]